MITINIIWLVITTIIAYCLGVHIGHNSRDWEIQEANNTVSEYRYKYDHARVPLLSQDSSGKQMYTCRRCGKRVYRSLKHCGCCGQKICWNFTLTEDGKVVVYNDTGR